VTKGGESRPLSCRHRRGADRPLAYGRTAAWAAVISAIAAFVLGLAGLAARRWFVALVCVVVNPGALFYTVLSSGALCG